MNEWELPLEIQILSNKTLGPKNNRKEIRGKWKYAHIPCLWQLPLVSRHFSHLWAQNLPKNVQHNLPGILRTDESCQMWWKVFAKVVWKPKVQKEVHKSKKGHYLFLLWQTPPIFTWDIYVMFKFRNTTILAVLL